MKDVLLFVPLDHFAKGQHEYIPLGVLYISAFLSAAGFEVDVIHGSTEDIKPGYKFYGLSAATASYNAIEEALHQIRKIQPNATVVAGGPHFNASQCVKEALELKFCRCHPIGLNWDHIVIGDGEQAMLDIVTRKETNRVVYGKRIELDNLPLPDYEKIDLSKYNYPLRNGLRCINILTSRGCPFNCQYCSTSRTKMSERSPDRVLQDAELLVNKYGFNSLMVADDNVSINKSRFYQILSGFENLKIKWRSLIRANTITDEGLDKMVRSGCIEVGPGIESGSQRILKIIKKNSKVEQDIQFVHKCEERGIRCVPSFIVGLPGEDEESIQATYEFMKKAKPSGFAYNILMPFPDSPIFLKRNTDFKDLITIYPYSWDDCITKSKKIERCFISTPALSREKILETYYKYYDIFAKMTNFDPRKRGNRE